MTNPNTSTSIKKRTSANDVFIAPKPGDDYTLNTTTWIWDKDE